MSAKKRKARDTGHGEYEISMGARKSEAGLVRFVGDLRKRREWEWLENDQPGLYEFLSASLGRWLPMARSGRSRRTANVKGACVVNEEKKAKAVEWQTRILPKVKRMLAAGKSTSNIATILAPEASRGAEMVKKFVASVRKELAKNSR